MTARIEARERRSSDLLTLPVNSATFSLKSFYRNKLLKEVFNDSSSILPMRVLFSFFS